MTQVRLGIDFINWGINFGFVVTMLFPFVVRLYWAWQESEWGWNIILLEQSIAFALLPIWLHHIGINLNMYVQIWTEAASLWFVPIVVIWRAWIIWRTQRHGKHREKKNVASRSQRME